ncbi:hypothetical protein [Pseudobacteriovorax antillogorgiicola]|uniref:Uncharacterized protein n=1 Tax=Pseudobacteriovorax antillogorgiicola TaxID=1513793 RepID=A0A1Y6CL21_9BACT|nr:hypothetical protein [Pseudobacteriovorax antillogorgiicola]TCS47264.1 hypothetical protein EDD56_12139 [Pseudobacteriovorax antillogorgiicola]SMF62129.1 hypothetical protein SAMN06296036_12139 [Pseudobacteriovorax antillogorgiicola]
MKASLLIIANFCWMACKPQKTDVEQLIQDQCVQHPIAFYMAEQESGTQIYQFGPKDTEFRELLEQLIDRYRRTGIDISGSEKLKLVRSYVPQYVDSCTSFFAPVQQSCENYALTSPEFRNCIRPFNQSFREQLQLNFRQSGTERLDLENVTFDEQLSFSSSQINTKH